MEMETEKIIANLVRKVEQRFYGKYRGQVKDNNDPETLGRLLVTVPGVLGEKVTVWAFPCVPYGGDANQGFFFIPEIDAGVWVEFEEGDPEFPIWVGTFWSKPGGKSEPPKPNNPDGSEKGEIQKPPTRKIVKTKKGHTIQLEDKNGEEMVTIVEAKNNNVITLNKDGIKITDGANGHEIVMKGEGITVTDGANGHEIVMNGDGIAVTDGVTNGNTVTMESSGIKVEAKSEKNIIIKGEKVTIESSAVKVGSSGAAEPLVLGTQLKTALDAFADQLKGHTHPNGNLGSPTGPPNPLPTLVLDPALSQKHKVE